MRTLRAAVVLGAIGIVAVLAGCSDARTPPGVRDAYAPLVEDPLWTATPPGYDTALELEAKCQLNDTAGLDEIYPARTLDGEVSSPSPIEFYRELAAEGGWSDEGSSDDGTELSLRKEHEGMTWVVHVETSLDQAEGIRASVDLLGSIEGIEICGDEG